MKTFNSTIITALSIVALLLANISSVRAQEYGDKKVEFGVRFMPTLSSFAMKNAAGATVTTKGVVGVGFGGFLGYNFSQNVGIQAEVIYNSISQKYTEVNLEQKVNLKYVNIPLLLSLNTGKYRLVNVNIVAGPQIGISAGSKLFTSGTATTSNDAVLAVKKGDLGFAYGGGFDVGITHNFRLGVGFRGVFGLFDISDHSASLVNNHYFILDKAHVKTYSGYVGISYLFL